jgi:hypothetical protein
MRPRVRTLIDCRPKILLCESIRLFGLFTASNNRQRIYPRSGWQKLILVMLNTRCATKSCDTIELNFQIVGVQVMLQIMQTACPIMSVNDELCRSDIFPFVL